MEGEKDSDIREFRTATGSPNVPNPCASDFVLRVSEFSALAPGRLLVRVQKALPPQRVAGLFGDPYGNRTHIFAVRGRRLDRLTKGPTFVDLSIIPHFPPDCKGFFKKNLPLDRFFCSFLFLSLEVSTIVDVRLTEGCI